ncbi:hypothetical protein FE783_30110 [Paenibacillus mesophilus]|uniref:hypothetical protein n=1 Tax=Paenibacillus mesophilus TaxID=2582849 RepID=UPI00110EEB91|nr:hypothetical protein [Paenibacillus mesophilus]TMV45116.1 hypothetical protein FE783_30110 [Paenibacillus mesophilus]
MELNKVAYSQIADQLETGDLLFCHGIVAGSLLVEKLEHCQWSHVGMVVRTADGQNLLWESTTADQLQDVRFHVKKTGPQLVRLIDRMTTDVSNNTDTLFAIRKLNAARSPGMIDAMNAFIGEVHDAVFPSEAKMYFEVLEGKVGIKTSYADFFCSKLVAATYIRMGLLSAERVPNDYEPKDFASTGHVRLQNGASWGEEMLITP